NSIVPRRGALALRTDLLGARRLHLEEAMERLRILSSGADALLADRFDESVADLRLDAVVEFGAHVELEGAVAGAGVGARDGVGIDDRQGETVSGLRLARPQRRLLRLGIRRRWQRLDRQPRHVSGFLLRLLLHRLAGRRAERAGAFF